MIGVASLALIITDNVLKLKDARSRIKDAASLLKTRKGTRDTTGDDGRSGQLSKLYRAIDEASLDAFLTRDPFAGIEQLPDFKLTGMVNSGGRPAAMINNEVVSAGDQINGFFVLEIGEDFVKLSDGEFDIDLQLYLPMEPAAPEPQPAPEENPEESETELLDESAIEDLPLEDPPVLPPIRELWQNTY